LPYNHEKIDKVKAIDGRRWSATHKCWHVAYSNAKLEILKSIFPELVKKTEG